MLEIDGFSIVDNKVLLLAQDIAQATAAQTVSPWLTDVLTHSNPKHFSAYQCTLTALILSLVVAVFRT